MEIYKIKNLTFKYPKEIKPALDNISLIIERGEFITVCGKSGCGKSTLMRQLKSVVCPHGTRTGEIYFKSRPLDEADVRTQSTEIGFVLQSPENQIVTDKVWHELAFGLESIGLENSEIRARVAEMASFFGIQSWFLKSVTELSGGQKQILNLASVMVMQPSVLILDEPTSRLDPIAAQEFLGTLSRINREIGTTVILTEHRLEEAFAISDRVIVMDEGKIIADADPCSVGELLTRLGHDMTAALPAAMRVFGGIDNKLRCPVTVRDGKRWLERLSESITPKPELIPFAGRLQSFKQTVIELDEVWFRYEKNLPDVIKGLSERIYKGELYAIVGGNGTGKTTAISLISGLFKPYRGRVLVNGKNINDIENKYSSLLGVLPQNPEALFVKKTVELDLYEMLSDRKLPGDKKAELVKNAYEICELTELLDRHPYDLSGGEQQRAALAKVLLNEPEILIMDEPTKGMDAHFKEKFAGVLKRLCSSGVTVVMVSHDIEFCAEYADRCAMFFDGNIVSQGSPREFFCGKSFYTTAANRMARSILPEAVLTDDIILAYGGKVKEKVSMQQAFVSDKRPVADNVSSEAALPKKRNILLGCIFAALFVIVLVLGLSEHSKRYGYAIQGISIIFALFALNAFFPGKPIGGDIMPQVQYAKRKLSKRTAAAAVMILFLIPLTIYIGIYYLGDRKYYFISLLIILEAMIPFFMIFEDRKPEARELIIISVLCAIAVAGRAAFFMLPQFKPVLAVVIISGVCFGGETGFLVGAVSGFVSNFFFSQGPWTPWQMFGFGITGFFAGVLFQKGFLRKTKLSLCIYGGFAALIIYGGIMNPASVIMWQEYPTREMFAAAYISGIPFDIIHAEATVFFLWFTAEPMVEKLTRVKIKYGLAE